MILLLIWAGLLVEPLGYQDSLCMTANAKMVVTDSGENAGRDFGAWSSLPNIARKRGKTRNDSLLNEYTHCLELAVVSRAYYPNRLAEGG